MIGLDVHIRWMIRRDLPEVLAIEAASFAVPWTADNFQRSLRARGTVGMVADAGRDEPDVVGWMVYDLHSRRIVLRRLATSPLQRRQGVGRALLAQLADKIRRHPQRTHIAADVWEDDLSSQLFLRACGFRCIRVDRGCELDTYAMEWRP